MLVKWALGRKNDEMKIDKLLLDTAAGVFLQRTAFYTNITAVCDLSAEVLNWGESITVIIDTS